ncbi:MAG: hypothetical protein WC718_02420 [Phycisphaerales bacterium]|jgi:hypothetical protein
MRSSRVLLRAVICVAALPLVALAQVSTVQTAEATGVSVGLPACGSAATYLASFATSSSCTLTTASGAAVGAFVGADEQLVASNLPAALNDAVGTVTWSIARGTLMTPSQPSDDVGLIVSHVHLVDGAGTITDFFAASVIPDETAAAAIEAIRATSGIEVVPENSASAARSLGSSCSCPACPLGGRFWAPFFVIGISNSPSVGQSCCALACDVGCAALHEGKPDAWLIGQGTWVGCMICG